MEDLLGRDLEVKSIEPGLEGSWYEAQVVRWMWKSECVEVEYRTLMCEEDESKPLREAVLLSNIRPRPLPLPEEEGSELQLQDWVEAFYRDGWWVGVIVGKVPESSTYTVFFPDSNENIEFERSLLRLHQHWDGGKWVSGSVEDVQVVMFPWGSKNANGNGAWLGERSVLMLNQLFPRVWVWDFPDNDPHHSRPDPPGSQSLLELSTAV